MKEILKHYKWDIVFVAAFIIFTFIFPVKKLSLACFVLFGVGIIQTVSNDKRIKEPYGSLFIIMALIIAAYFYRKLW